MKQLLLGLAITLLLGCNQEYKYQSSDINVIPEPVSITQGEGRFQLTRKTKIVVPTGHKEVEEVSSYLKNKLDSSTGYDIKVRHSNNASESGSIIFNLDSDTTTFGNSEGYTLDVSPDTIQLNAATPQGLFYGVQSLLQLFPPQIFQADYTLVPQNTEWTVPAVAIKDYPRFAYRGMHLDVGRHFFGVKFVKEYIDLLAMNKMNRFHWHLTEDQGWRIEIKKYPKLTQVGAWRDSTLVGHYKNGIYDHQRYGGFYTQDEIRDVVAYAKKRFVTVVPEIEMPGHSSAALAAYPQLGCDENADYHVQGKWGVHKDLYCPSEYTFNFLEDVLTEVMDLFPSKYIHIGGDEAPKDAWENSELAQKVIKREGLKNEHELQSYFIQRIEKFLNSHGRQIIGWDEILEGGLAPNATVMSWRGIKGGIEAAKQHHNVIMSPTDFVYLDYYQADPETEPLAIGGYLPLEKVYSYEPIPDELTEKEAKYIIGVQANVWTEYINSGKKVEYMAYPRASAVAEIAWSPKNKRNFTSFWRRLQNQFKHLDIMDINYADHYKGKMPPMIN